MARRIQQMLLLCALALSVIGMHHVPAAPPDAPVAVHAEHQPGPAPADDTEHELLHLCLVALWTTGGFLFLAWLSVAAGARARVHAVRRRLRRTDRPPGPYGRLLLTVLCVQRT